MISTNSKIWTFAKWALYVIPSIIAVIVVIVTAIPVVEQFSDWQNGVTGFKRDLFLKDLAILGTTALLALICAPLCYLLVQIGELKNILSGTDGSTFMRLGNFAGDEPLHFLTFTPHTKPIPILDEDARWTYIYSVLSKNTRALQNYYLSPKFTEYVRNIRATTQWQMRVVVLPDVPPDRLVLLPFLSLNEAMGIETYFYTKSEYHSILGYISKRENRKKIFAIALLNGCCTENFQRAVMAHFTSLLESQPNFQILSSQRSDSTSGRESSCSFEPSSTNPEHEVTNSLVENWKANSDNSDCEQRFLKLPNGSLTWKAPYYHRKFDDDIVENWNIKCEKDVALLIALAFLETITRDTLRRGEKGIERVIALPSLTSREREQENHRLQPRRIVKDLIEIINETST